MWKVKQDRKIYPYSLDLWSICLQWCCNDTIYIDRHQYETIHIDRYNDTIYIDRHQYETIHIDRYNDTIYIDRYNDTIYI